MTTDTPLWTFERYSPADEARWNTFVDNSRNATFLFSRRFMDYHSDRFDDFSLLAFRKGRLKAILPAAIEGETLCSHPGLTYGGWCFPPGSVDAADIVRLFADWRDWCRQNGISSVIYKPLPLIYHRRPSQEDIYALWRLGATMEQCDISCAVDLRHPAPFSPQQRAHLRQAENHEFTVCETDDADGFHSLLAECLKERHGASPVHSADELRMLRGRFPENILLFTLSSECTVHAQTCIFLTDRVAHCQYIATTPEGRRRHFLTLLISRLLDDPRIAARSWFDFGTSNEDHGRRLNESLFRSKFELGGGGVAYTRFSFST